jgi:CheY-like chemotaxis protein
MFVQCPNCLKRYRLNESQAKLVRIRCRGCGGEFLASPSLDPRHEVSARHATDTAVVADIQRDFRSVLVEILVRMGFRIVVAEDGLTALREIQEHRPRLLLVNPYLPELMGIELVARLRAEGIAPQTIILLGAIHSSKRYRRRPESLYGADDYLDEGGSDEAIMSKIEYHLHMPPSAHRHAAGEDEEAMRLARSVFADLLVYDPARMAQVQSTDDFFRLFRDEAAEGKRYIETRRRGASSLLSDVVAHYLHGS